MKDNVAGIAGMQRLWDGGYIRPVSGQRLDKHVPAVTITHATGETECCLLRPRRGVKNRELGQPVRLRVGCQFCTELKHGSRGLAIVNIRYQETSCENIAEDQPLLRPEKEKIFNLSLKALNML
jgi:hypothetical protein